VGKMQYTLCEWRSLGGESGCYTGRELSASFVVGLVNTRVGLAVFSNGKFTKALRQENAGVNFM
jgi:hypothetical protein